MKYALLIHEEESGRSGSVGIRSGAYREMLERLRADGRFRGARVLSPAAGATTVRTREGVSSATPGPSTVMAKPLTAFVIVECEGEDGATELASQVAVAADAAVEVRLVERAGEGGSLKSGVSEGSAGGTAKEFAFVINVQDGVRPWPGSSAFDDLMERCGLVLERLESQSRFRGTERLGPAAGAKHVRMKEGKPALMDGPFSEARELIGGFILGDCESLEEAVELAGMIPGSASGCVEVREIVGTDD